MIEGNLYSVNISDTVLHHVHGMSRGILELYIPRYQIAMNEDGWLFRTGNPRNSSFSIVDVPNDLEWLASTLPTQFQSAKLNEEWQEKVKKWLK